MAIRTKLAFITFIYWFLLVYMVAALVWWFIALNQQAGEMADLRISMAKPSDSNYAEELQFANDFKNRKRAQYIGEGSIFLVLIGLGAIFVYRAARKQIAVGQQQRNFLMAVTHELKTPIAAARLNIETLQKHTLDETKQKALLKGALAETERLNDLTNNILLASRMEGGESFHFYESLDLRKLIQDVFKQFKSRYPQIEWVQNDFPSVWVKGDDLLLRILVSNLLDNAVKYGSEGKSVLVNLEPMAGNAVFTVADAGKGIPEEEKKKVFDKFYRIGNENTRTKRGTGLGLFLCKKIVEAHHGFIAIENNIPSGSVFKVVLPVS